MDGRTAPARQTLSSSPCYESHLLPVDYAGLDLTLTLDPILCEGIPESEESQSTG